jgi:hypothetical protein
VQTAILELQSGTGSQIFHGAGDEHLSRPSARKDTLPDVHRNPGETVAKDLDFSGVEPRADLDAQLADAVAYDTGALHRARRTVEGGQEAVAGRIDLAPLKS